MRAATMKERLSFQLMCQTDVQTIYHIQMLRGLFSDPRYADMSLDAKVAYTFLLNRFQPRPLFPSARFAVWVGVWVRCQKISMPAHSANILTFQAKL